MMQIQCEWCHAIVTHEPRHITGCNCDPDAPQWCYIDRDATPKGLGQAKWKLITNSEGTNNETNTEDHHPAV